MLTAAVDEFFAVKQGASTFSMPSPPEQAAAVDRIMTVAGPDYLKACMLEGCC